MTTLEIVALALFIPLYVLGRIVDRWVQGVQQTWRIERQRSLHGQAICGAQGVGPGIARQSNSQGRKVGT